MYRDPRQPPAPAAHVCSCTTDRLLYKIDDAARLLSVSPRTLRKALQATITSEGIPPLQGRRLGREWRIDRDALLDWAESLPEG